MLQSAAMRCISVCQDAGLQRIATTVCESALTRHHMDFERVDRRSEAITQLKGTIVDLKSRLELKTGGRSHLAVADAGLQLSYKAS